MPRPLAILGSTGSIGVSTLDVVAAHPREFPVAGLAAGGNVELMVGQIAEHQPKLVALSDEEAADRLREQVRGTNVAVRGGPEGVLEVATMEGAETVVAAIVGAQGLLPTLEAIRAGKTVALANKESLVCAGALVVREAAGRGNLIPIDSEHSAIFQCLAGQDRSAVRRIILTGSGGPFHGRSPEEMAGVKAQEALNHPTWEMGPKVTIDSATLMNKGLEVIEAHWLFGLPPERIEVVIHRQSIVHSLVEFTDGSMLAQLGPTDMRLPIAYALSYPRRMALNQPSLSLVEVGQLSFEQPDEEAFPCLKYAYEALERGGTLPAVLNAANEVAVQAFLEDAIGFLDIPRLIRAAMDGHQPKPVTSLDVVMEADRWARRLTHEAVAVAADGG
ncbi:MAG: 1-deoxy-D-xylulose-5-phosphate reductoisomerase [Nitrospinae bacterium]|nr:1-deoxy-D-xylulose-5-phosphate reductoisomerase [Nitrospinota bacterium]